MLKELKTTRTTDFKVPTGVLGAALSPDGESLFAACMDGVYRTSLTDKSVERIGEHSSYVSSAVACGRTNQLITAGYDGSVQWFDLETSESLRRSKVHDFWSWDMALSPDEKLLASVTGQYLAGGYKYEPLPEREPSLRVLDAATGEILHSLPHVPSVQAVAFSHDSRHVAAGNLMGEVRIWNTQTGELVSSLTTPAFTSWGIIKSHCYLGGVFAMRFTPNDEHLLLAGMGPMRDPMAGNGKQLWQRWSWASEKPELEDETHDGESGQGLMETLAVHPDGTSFVMGGRLRGGDWNVAIFDLATGDRQHILKTGYRVSEALFSDDGSQLILVGTQGQPKKQKDGKFPDFGQVEVYNLD